MFKRSFTNGFTLIEVLVVVSIIAVLTTIGLTVFSGSISKARDATRKKDLKEIATALELYYQKNNRYPCSATAPVLQTTSTLDSRGFWIKEDPNSACGTTHPLFDQGYMLNMPIDPKSNNFSETDNTTFGYAYRSYAVSAPIGCDLGKYYYLETRLENVNDPDSCKNKQYKDCVGTSFCVDNSDAKNALFVITSQQQ